MEANSWFCLDTRIFAEVWFFCAKGLTHPTAIPLQDLLPFLSRMCYLFDSADRKQNSGYLRHLSLSSSRHWGFFPLGLCVYGQTSEEPRNLICSVQYSSQMLRPQNQIRFKFKFPSPPFTGCMTWGKLSYLSESSSLNCIFKKCLSHRDVVRIWDNAHTWKAC